MSEFNAGHSTLQPMLEQINAPGHFNMTGCHTDGCHPVYRTNPTSCHVSGCHN